MCPDKKDYVSVEIDGERKHVTEMLFIAKSERTSHRMCEYLFQNSMKKLLNSVNYVSCDQNGVSCRWTLWYTFFLCM